MNRSMVVRIICITLLWTLPVFVATDFILAMDIPDDSIAARVNDTSIHASRVKQLVRRLLGTREATPTGRKTLERMALEQLIDRQLVLDYLKQRGELASDREVGIEIDRLKNRLVRREKKLADFLRDRNETVDALRQEFLWTLSWQRYVGKQITEDRIRKYFEQHRPEFDGSQLRVAHILLKTGDELESRRQAISRLQNVRRRILDGELSFAEAAQSVSNAPTGKNGGNLGWIERDRPMPESFSKAAFALTAGEISPPVTTSMGVHLIQCLEIKPGRKSWQDVRAALTTAMTRHLFTRACQEQRPKAKIERIMEERSAPESAAKTRLRDGSGA